MKNAILLGRTAENFPHHTDQFDESYARPVFDDDDNGKPGETRRIAGHFEGTEVTFRFFLPAAERWERRFFQFTYPVDGQEPVNSVAFGDAHGGITVQTSGAPGYSHLASAAMLARLVAAEHYEVESTSISGYLYGWSGGSFQTIGAIENTRGIWQGAVSIVQGLPTSVPNNFAVRCLAARALASSREQLGAALRPGGSGDPFAELDPLQTELLTEATRMGVPLRAWEDFDYLADDRALNALGHLVRSADPTYSNDFWSHPGYEGTEDSALGTFLRTELAKDDTPDTRWNLALLCYHRHALPTAGRFPIYDALYRDADGTPASPQRDFVASEVSASGTSGNAPFDGTFGGKLIVVEGILDCDAFPWHGAWYADQAARAQEDLDGVFRIWYTDHADHGPYDRDGARSRLVGYMPVVFQALRDVAAWAEQGTPPAPSTAYRVIDGQVIIGDDARTRGGIQPSVRLTVPREAAADDPVEFTASVALPPGAGSVVWLEWDASGGGDFDRVWCGPDAGGSTFNYVHRYPEAGTYYPAIRVGCQREGDPNDVTTVVVDIARTRLDVR